MNKVVYAGQRRPGGKWKLLYCGANTETPHRKKRIWVHRLELPIGFIDLGFYGREVYIDDMKVYAKRRGYGTRLVELALQHAKRLGIKQLWLWSLARHQACSFWKTFGVTRFGSILTGRGE